LTGTENAGPPYQAVLIEANCGWRFILRDHAKAIGALGLISRRPSPSILAAEEALPGLRRPMP